MTNISVKNIGQPVKYIKCDILSGGDQSICKGILKRIHKRNIYGYVCYDILTKNGKKVFKNELQVWR